MWWDGYVRDVGKEVWGKIRERFFGRGGGDIGSRVELE
jgi:hypothetical protein